MSLIHDLRKEYKQPEAEEKSYNPLFLTAIKKRGYFLMSNDTFDLETMDCVRKTGKRFDVWLKENKLKLVTANIQNHYKIYF